jgi:hypothetical protein
MVFVFSFSYLVQDVKSLGPNLILAENAPTHVGYVVIFQKKLLKTEFNFGWMGIQLRCMRDTVGICCRVEFAI